MAFREKTDHIFRSRPHLKSPRKQKHHDLTPHTGQHRSLPSLASCTFPSPRQSDALTHSAGMLPSLHFPVFTKPRLTSGSHQKLWEIPVSKCRWWSMVPCTGGLWALQQHSLTPLSAQQMVYSKSFYSKIKIYFLNNILYHTDHSLVKSGIATKGNHAPSSLKEQDNRTAHLHTHGNFPTLNYPQLAGFHLT